MAKTVFRPSETKVENDKVMLPLVRNYAPEEEVEEEVVEEYTGPTVEESQQKIVSIIRRLEDSGDIVIARSGEDELVT